MVKRFALFNEPDFEYMESFLEDMAGKGLLLDHYGIAYAYFNKSEPCKRRYRIVPKILNAVSEDEIALYESAGWQYVGKKSGTGLNIFCTDDSEAPEIFTDMGSFRMYAKKYALSGTLSIISMLILLYLTFNSAADLFIHSGGMLHLISDMGPFLLMTVILVLPFVVAVVTSFVISEFNTMHKILAAKPIMHNLEYKGKIRFHAVTTSSVIILAVIIFIGQFFVFAESSDRDATASYNGSHPASYEIVDPEGWSKVEKALATREWPEDISFDIFTKSGVFFKEKNEAHTDIGSNYMRAVYGVAKSEKIAEKWLGEEILYDVNERQSPDDIALESYNGLDYIGFYTDKGGTQIIYMRKGNVIEKILYYGDKDIALHMDEFAEDLLK